MGSVKRTANVLLQIKRRLDTKCCLEVRSDFHTTRMESTNVLVIGAGASGVAAACKLLENGINDVLVLEAGNGIGGRIQTVKFGNSFVDLGAHWVHGETGNIVSAIAQSLDMLSDTVTEIVDTQFVSSSGDWVSTDVTEKFLSMIMEIVDTSEEQLKYSKASLGDYVTKEFEKKLSENNLSKVEKFYAKYCLDWFEKFENSIDGSDSWFHTSASGHTEYKECEGNLLQTWKERGYGNIFDILMKKVPDPRFELPFKSKLLLNKEVINIEWDGTDGDKVAVKCADGSKFIANHVIVTVSLGVLKEKANTLFTPQLPAKKLNAIRGLSIGTVDKIYLRFPHKWWPDSVQGFSLLWLEEDLLKFNKEHDASGSNHWLTDVFGFYEADLNPDTLCGWIVGPSARTMETMSDKEVMDGCMELLDHFLGSRFKIPRPIEMLKTTWFKNPHVRGSYSYRSMTTEKLNAWPAHLAEPLTNSKENQTVLFAGEATHDHFFSTVHGAIETGWREADRVINLLRLPLPSKL